MNNLNFEEIKKLAEQGIAEAQHNLGKMYANEIGVTENNEEAEKWFTLAAEQGLEYAQHNLGVMYHYGLSVTIDVVEAVKWYSGVEKSVNTISKRYYPTNKLMCYTTD